MSETYDLVVVGGGPGGYGAALYAAAGGLSVALVEKDKVGGTCLHRGCIPAKELLETAHLCHSIGGAKEFGLEVDQPTVDVATMMGRKDKVVGQLFKGVQSLLKGRKVTVLSGTGQLAGPGVVTVEGPDAGEVRGRAVILASGSVPKTIPGFEVDGRFVLTSDEVFELDRLPASVAVIGGGAIGCEFASMLSDLGSEVTILEALPQILPGVDADVMKIVERSFTKRGITIHTGVSVDGHTPGDTTTSVAFGDGQQVDVEAVVVSVGRRPLSDGLLADGTGVELDERGFVVVDEWCRTNAAGVFAIGDVIATPGLAHVGFAEAILVVKQLLDEAAVPVDHARVPWCIYCRPEVAFAGLTEQQARDAGHDVVVSKHRLTGNSRAMIVGETEGLVKVVAEKSGEGAGQILGVHLAGPWVTEQLGAGYLAVNWEATVDDVAHFVQPHPTLSETFGETVMSLTGRGLHG